MSKSVQLAKPAISAYDNHMTHPMPNHLPRLILAAPMSGSGKTTITAGLIAALAARGIQVAPFKCGPDYIDPSYHTLAAGRPCRNLDAWLTPPETICARMVYHSTGANLALIEGVMGLFDGHVQGEARDAARPNHVGSHNEAHDNGSTAHIARLTDSPVVVILDARGMARTAAALMAGLRDFDPRVHVAGVILNRVGSARHAQIITEAIETYTGLPVFGFLPRESELALPERHLGLVPTHEAGDWQNWLTQLQTQVEAHIDIDRLLAVAKCAPALPPLNSPFHIFAPSQAPRPTIAVARDAAFSFHYEENLELLQAAGAEIAYFSPMHDTTLPAHTQAIYLCGGFPELYAESLSQNQAMLIAIRAAAAAGQPIYAECGGLIYLTETVEDSNGHPHALVGLLPGRTKMTKRVTLGYRTVQACRDSWLWRAGESVRGHEFHYSISETLPDAHSCLYEVKPHRFNAKAYAEGVHLDNIVASYVHLHFLSMPILATRFVEAARAALPITPQP